MFNKYNIIHQRSGPSHITVTEKRAPTDESVKLLKDMEKAARDSVIDSIRVTTSTMDGVVVYAMRSPESFENVLYIRFNLNGKPYKVEQVIKEHSFVFDKAAAARALCEAIREAIFQELFTDVVKEVENGLAR